jgi:Na+/H+-dicarboxylate symporter
MNIISRCPHKSLTHIIGPLYYLYIYTMYHCNVTLILVMNIRYYSFSFLSLLHLYYSYYLHQFITRYQHETLPIYLQRYEHIISFQPKHYNFEPNFFSTKAVIILKRYMMQFWCNIDYNLFQPNQYYL